MPSCDVDRSMISRAQAARLTRSDLHGDLKGHVARDGITALIWGMTWNSRTFPMTTRIAVGGVTLLFALPACSGSSNKPEPATTSSFAKGSSTTVSTIPDPRKQVIAAVRAFWDVYLEVGARRGTFNASDTRARLAERASGKELSKLFDVFQGNAAAGYVVKGTIDVSPTVVSVGRTTAQVRDCYDDKTGLYRIGDGTRVDKDDARRHKVLMTLVLDGNVWKVSTITDEGLGCSV